MGLVIFIACLRLIELDERRERERAAKRRSKIEIHRL